MKKKAKKLRSFLLLIIVIYFVVGLTKGCLHNRKIIKKYNELQKQYQKELEFNKELRLKLQQAKTTSFIELMARKKLGLIKPGEIIYKIVEE